MNLPSSRLLGFDNLRLAVIALVVLVHSNATYSGIGSWYYVEVATESLDPIALVVLGTCNMFLQAWFMGALFFVAGLFAVGSLERQGRLRFLGNRGVRLLGPYLLFVLVIGPLMLLAYRPAWLPTDLFSLLSASGPLWFTLTLFVFLSVWVLVAGKPTKARPLAHGPTSTGTLVALAGVTALAIAAAAWLLRVRFPVGAAVANLQLGFFASYAVFFAAGLWFARDQRLGVLPSRWSHLVWITPLVSIPALVIILVVTGTISGSRAFLGDGTGESFLYALWESLTAVAMVLGLVVAARDHQAKEDRSQSRVLTFFRANAFGVYVLHAPVLWGLSLALSPLVSWAPLKAVFVAAAAFALTSLVSSLARTVPGLNKFLS